MLLTATQVSKQETETSKGRGHGNKGAAVELGKKSKQGGRESTRIDPNSQKTS